MSLNPSRFLIITHLTESIRWTRGILTALITTLILCGLGCDTGQGDDSQIAAEIPQQTLHGFSTSHSEAGVVKWVLVGSEATFLNKAIAVKEPIVEIFEDGESKITLTGIRGEIIKHSNDIHLFDQVVGESKDGRILTDELHWRNQAGKLYAPNQSKILRGDSTVTGGELEASPSLEKLTMKNTRFRINPKDEEINE
ncbi:MAG: LPS export ABC transporter periplasmic protein LptC [Candidatus Poribacteria bacterium]|nr:LPS export ABC transporter periplasmic protein LptC [Candidatus Poribacteria bacterium]MDE0506942.1 LPS export ABC transporter periplasmic protein LptC [Candidatus Poribacteria bacterium]